MSLVEVADVRCTRTASSRADEERSDRPTLVLPRRGVFRYRGTRSVTADANTVLFFHPDEPYRITHPVDGGDACTALRYERDVVDDALTPLGDCARAWILERTARNSVHALAEGVLKTDDPLERDEKALAILALLARSAPSRANGHHAQRIEQVRERLAAIPGDGVSIETLAREAGMSAFQLMRRFRAHTGTSLHQYRMLLRLSIARTMLREGADDITSIAADLGFANAAHFASAFRRAFRCRPSDIRKARDAAAQRNALTTSANVENDSNGTARSAR